MTKPEDGSITSQGKAMLKVKRAVTIPTETWNKDYKGVMSWEINSSEWLYVSWGKFGDRNDQDGNKVQGPYWYDNEGAPAY